MTDISYKIVIDWVCRLDRGNIRRTVGYAQTSAFIMNTIETRVKEY